MHNFLKSQVFGHFPDPLGFSNHRISSFSNSRALQTSTAERWIPTGVDKGGNAATGAFAGVWKPRTYGEKSFGKGDSRVSKNRDAPKWMVDNGTPY